MKTAIGADHGGFALKQQLSEHLRGQGHEVLDVGTNSTAAVDYPTYARKVAEAVASGAATRGIMIDGAGIGSSMVANKVAGVRAAPCHDALTAEMSRRHNDANVLCLSSDMLGDRVINSMVDIWLDTEFEGGRHARRLEKITKLENE